MTEAEDNAQAGRVTAQEAREIVDRFIASHWNKRDQERARFTIPADPRRDDDIRMIAFIARAEALEAEAAQVRQAMADFADLIERVRCRVWQPPEVAHRLRALLKDLKEMA